MRVQVGFILSIFLAVGAVLGSVSVVHAALSNPDVAALEEKPRRAATLNNGTGEKSRSLDKCMREHPLVAVLFDVGFRNGNLREAWAIAMRESSGDASLGPGHPSYNGFDMGLFQLNRPSFSQESWWDEGALLDARYNASVAFALSDGGRNWWPWGLDGQGNTDAGAYRHIWTQEQIDTMITIPFRKYYRAYPCR